MVLLSASLASIYISFGSTLRVNFGIIVGNSAVLQGCEKSKAAKSPLMRRSLLYSVHSLALGIDPGAEEPGAVDVHNIAQLQRRSHIP